MLTVRAELLSATGPEVELIASGRPRGVFSRQVILGDALDTGGIHAPTKAGVLRLNIPAAEKAKPRKIAIASERGPQPLCHNLPQARRADLYVYLAQNYGGADAARLGRSVVGGRS